jgi:hypothetical protein
MKKLPFIFIPAIVAIVIVVAVLGYRMLNTTLPTQFPNSTTNGQTKNPTAPLGGLSGNITPTPTPATAADLNNELKDTVDDGGKSDLDALTKEASGL